MKYTSEFRVEAVRLVTDGSRPIKSVASQLGVNSETLRVWVSRARSEMSKDVEGKTPESEKELKALLRRIHDLEMENAFLKKAAAFFASEQNQKNGLR